MDGMWQDLRYGWRKLIRSPGFTVVAVVTLALGIGANTAIFSVVNAVLLRDLPYSDPDRLVLIWNRMENSSFDKAPVAAPDIVEYREETTLFEQFAATNNVSEAALTGEGEPERIKVALVTPNFFRVLGVEPAIGRDFRTAEGRPLSERGFDHADALPVGAFVMSDGLWRRRFGADPGVIGRTIRIDGAPMTVVGVMPRDFELLMPPDAGMPTDIDGWTPLRVDLASAPRENQWLRVIARLKPGVELSQARAEMEALASRQRERHRFHANMGIGITVVPMHADVVGHVRPILVALLGAVGFVLLIACANVANLLLARATTRSREMAVRSALGAGRGRIMRQVLTEGLLLSLLGGTAGLLLARVGIGLLADLRPANLPRIEEIGIDGPVLAFTFLATVLAALLFGLVPALGASEARACEALRERGADSGSGNLRLRGGLVVAEVALSLVLLIGAGLMLRSFVAIQRVHPGFDPEGVLTYSVQLPFSSYGSADERVRFYRRMEERIESLPGVEAVGGVFPVPLGGRFWTGPYGLPGTDPERWTEKEANLRVVTAGFFEAFGSRLIAGRTIERADIEDGRKVAVVDELMAERAWPGRSPIGERIGLDLFGNRHWLEVVGVVEHMRHADLTADGRETVYFPHHLFPFTQMTMATRSAADAGQLTALVRREIAALNPELPVYDVRMMANYVRDAQAPTRFALVLIGIFGAVALVLASVGLYGIIGYAVRQRAREIGIRVAFGARKEDIVQLVLRRGLILVLAGVGLGILVAVGLTRVLSGLLYGVAAIDPLTYVAISILLIGVAAAACYLPAVRVTRLDPSESLRVE